MLSITTPQKLIVKIASRAKEMRLAANLSRKTLSLKSGIPEPTIRNFENTGQISLAALCRIAWVLDAMSEFETLFSERPPVRIEQLLESKRMRGRK